MKKKKKNTDKEDSDQTARMRRRIWVCLEHVSKGTFLRRCDSMYFALKIMEFVYIFIRTITLIAASLEIKSMITINRCAQPADTETWDTRKLKLLWNA